MLLKKIISVALGIVSIFLFITPAFAHVIVYPHQVGIAVTQDFTVSVPNERDNPVVEFRLRIPGGLKAVVPDALQGWTIVTKKSGSGEDTAITEIDWKDGSIPVSQRQEFIFQAQAPAQPTTLAWKAYQTYSDGTIISWDVGTAKVSNLSDAQQDQLADKEHKGEYSMTQVINDLAVSNATASENTNEQSAQIAELFSGIAVVLALGALFVCLKKKE